VTRRRAIVLVAAASVFVILAAALPLILAVRGQRIAARLHAFLAERFRARPDCPLADPFVEPGVSVWDCYDGHVDATHPVTLIVGSEPGSRIEVANYVAFYLPPSVAPGEAWLLAWKQRVAGRGDFWAVRSGAPNVRTRRHLFVGPPETLPIRADRTDDGGAIVAWKLTTLATREKLEARLRELGESFTASP
jgi:hypothetical protein